MDLNLIVALFLWVKIAWLVSVIVYWVGVLDGAGNPLDNKGPLKTEAQISLNGVPINPVVEKTDTRIA